MTRVLVTYASMAGSTAEIAERVARTLGAQSAEVLLKPLDKVSTLDDIDAVVVCAPMIVGWHRAAKRFLAEFEAILAQKPVALCMTCYEFTDTGMERVGSVPLTVDPQLCTATQSPDKLSLKQKNTTANAYVQGALKPTPGITPVSVGIFRGKIDFSKLGLLPMLFVRVLIRARAGDYRNWDAITAWATDLNDSLAAAQ